MFDELETLLTSLAFEESGWLKLAAVTWDSPSCAVTFDLHVDLDFGRDDVASTLDVGPQRWVYHCAEWRTSRLLANTPVTDLALLDDHVLLAPYTEPQATLSFYGVPADLKAVVADLWAAHRAATDGWWPLEEFLNDKLPLADLLGSGSGVLAQGPQGLLEAYAAVLRQHGLAPSWPTPRPAARVPSARFTPEPQLRKLQTLIWGDSYVVGTGFTAQRVR